MKRIFFLLLILAIASCHRPIEESMVAIQIQDRNGLTETISNPERLENYNRLDFFSSQPFKKILRVYKKDGKTHSKITTYHPNGSLWQYLEAAELRAFGTFKEWHPNGQLKVEAQVIGGTADVSGGAQRDWLFDGISQVWDEQGHLLAKIPYKQGVLEGKSLYFFPSGQLEKELSFYQDHLEGDSLEYYSNGQIQSKTTYRQGIKQGQCFGYFETGRPSYIEEYTEDLILKGSYYDPEGRKISEVEDGFGFKAIFEKNALSMLVQIRQGSAEGGVKKFTPQGDLQAQYHVKNGRKHGEEITYFLPRELTEIQSGPVPKLSVTWDKGLVHGSVKTWYNNGQLQSQREFAHNKKSGPSLSWYRDGSLMLLEEYEEDKLVKGQYFKKNGRDAVSSVVNGSGIATLFDEVGIFLRKINYVKGEPVAPEN